LAPSSTNSLEQRVRNAFAQAQEKRDRSLGAAKDTTSRPKGKELLYVANAEARFNGIEAALIEIARELDKLRA
jgi:hypothetical protein